MFERKNYELIGYTSYKFGIGHIVFPSFTIIVRDLLKFIYKQVIENNTQLNNPTSLTSFTFSFKQLLLHM